MFPKRVGQIQTPDRLTGLVLRPPVLEKTDFVIGMYNCRLFFLLSENVERATNANYLAKPLFEREIIFVRLADPGSVAGAIKPSSSSRENGISNRNV